MLSATWGQSTPALLCNTQAAPRLPPVPTGPSPQPGHTLFLPVFPPIVHMLLPFSQRGDRGLQRGPREGRWPE